MNYISGKLLKKFTSETPDLERSEQIHVAWLGSVLLRNLKSRRRHVSDSSRIQEICPCLGQDSSWESCEASLIQTVLKDDN